MFHLFSSKHTNVATVLDNTLSRLQKSDPETIAAIAMHAGTHDPAAVEDLRRQIMSQCEDAKTHLANDPKTAEPDFASRDPFVALVQTNMGQEAHRDPPALADLANDWQQYGDVDLRWALCPIVSFLAWKGPKASFHSSSNANSFVKVEHRQKFTIAIMADWGAATTAAEEVSREIQKRNPDYVIHLGDIYYAGTKAECEATLKMWPLKGEDGISPRKEVSYSLNGNHEMFCGGRNYFGTILPALGQLSSYFKIKTEYWQFLGLDTAYAGGRLDSPEVRDQWTWLVDNINQNPSLSTIFLTHHQPVSAHSHENDDAKHLREDVKTLKSQSRQNAIYGWIFGHEHRMVVYDDKVVGYKARLIGNGAIPHDAQNEDKPENGATEFRNVNKGTWGSGNAISSFILLTVEGPKITIEYIDQNGQPSCIPKEEWIAGAVDSHTMAAGADANQVRTSSTVR